MPRFQGYKNPCDADTIVPCMYINQADITRFQQQFTAQFHSLSISAFLENGGEDGRRIHAVLSGGRCERRRRTDAARTHDGPQEERLP